MLLQPHSFPTRRSSDLTKKTKDGYIVEARIKMKSKPENGQVLGIELQVNDAVGSERVGTINVFDSTGNAWNDTRDRKSTRLNSSHVAISYAFFCLKKNN